MLSHTKLIIVFFLSVLFLGSVVSTSASAVSPSPTTRGKPSSMPSQAKNKLTEVRLQACEAREESIKTRAGNLSRMATSMLTKFDSIAARVKAFHTGSGKTVEGYDALVTETVTKRAAVESALAAAQADVAGFSCTGEDPKGHATQFLADMKLVKAALKDYRTSIKNLIVAVRSVNGDGDEADETEVEKSPKASASPKASKSPNPNSQGKRSN